MIEYILAILLIGVMPARALYKSLRGKRDKANRPKTYIQSSAIIVGLLVGSRRLPQALGLLADRI